MQKKINKQSKLSEEVDKWQLVNSDTGVIKKEHVSDRERTGHVKNARENKTSDYSQYDFVVARFGWSQNVLVEVANFPSKFEDCQCSKDQQDYCENQVLKNGQQENVDFYG